MRAHVHILGFRPKPCQSGDQKRRTGGDDRQRQTVIAAGAFGDFRLQRIVHRRDQVAQLIASAGEGAARRSRRELVEMRRNNALCALHTDLHQKGTQC
jgi:hypothetical protein